MLGRLVDPSIKTDGILIEVELFSRSIRYHNTLLPCTGTFYIKLESNSGLHYETLEVSVPVGQYYVFTNKENLDPNGCRLRFILYPKKG